MSKFLNFSTNTFCDVDLLQAKYFFRPSLYQVSSPHCYENRCVRGLPHATSIPKLTSPKIDVTFAISLRQKIMTARQEDMEETERKLGQFFHTFELLLLKEKCLLHKTSKRMMTDAINGSKRKKCDVLMSFVYRKCREFFWRHAIR